LRPRQRIQRYSFLRGLQDSNETLFYALLTGNIEEIMPVVYTPTVGAYVYPSIVLGAPVYARYRRTRFRAQREQR
jgi:malic enzyme